MLKKYTTSSIFLVLSLCFFQQSMSFKLDRVILTCNEDTSYLQLWPLAARAWKDIVGVQPTLILVAEDDVQVDDTVGDVLRFKPVPDVPTALQAHYIRLLVPALYPDDVCIVSHIELIPLQQKFFTKYIESIPEDCFVIYRNHYYWWSKPRININYVAAKGSVFREIFGVQTMDEIAGAIYAWQRLGKGWDIDEKLLQRYINSWAKENKHRIKKLGFSSEKKKRISRKNNYKYSKKRLKKGKYIEFKCPMPYEEHKGTIDEILHLALYAAELKRVK